MTRLEIRSLAHFLAVLDERSLGRAARRVNLSQPALSKSIRQLEASLGVQLFERAVGGMTPTRHGAALADRARLIVEEARTAQEEMERLSDVWKGTVTVGAGPSIAASVLAQAVADLRTLRPGLRITVLEGMLEHHLPSLLNGSTDFVVGTAGDPVPKAIVAESLFRDTVAVVARAGHALAGPGVVPLDRLAAFPFVLPRAPEVLRDGLERRFAQAGVAFPQHVIDTNSLPFMKALVAAGDALAYLPRLAITAEERAGLLVPLSVPEATWHREVHLLRRARGTLSPSARALLQALRTTCATLGAVPREAA
ncbi:LysR family transcriptional regulator [Roseomonas sp. CCTCC AB2023176]|uniref:LysR family transcriptional regulator n=1 Tax=Roseomonas sp. CCTCC AB2023176 TaxID=3342640 RepID=UPI0035E2F709